MPAKSARSKFGHLFRLAIAVILCVAPSWCLAAGTFYVDGSNPSCSDSGLGSAGLPYCTISAAVAARGGPGTTINVNPAVYHEQVTVAASGSPDSPFLIKAVGSSVVVDGADDFSAPDQWVQVSGNVWLASGVTWSPKQVFADGARLAASTASTAALPALRFKYVSHEGLYVNAGGGNPAAHGLGVGHRLYGFQVAGPSWVNIDGFSVTRCEEKGIYVANSTGRIEITHNQVRWIKRFGIHVTKSSNILVGSNVVSDNGDHGIALTLGVIGSTVTGNESSRNARPSAVAANGLYLFGSSFNEISNNRLHDNQSNGLQIQSESNNNVSIQNVSWSNGQNGYSNLYASGTMHIGDVAWGNGKDGFGLEGGAIGVRLFNCIAVNNGVALGEHNLSIDSSSDSGYVADYNLFWNSSGNASIKRRDVAYPTVAAFAVATGLDSHSTESDPLFVAPEAGDFHLRAGSPAIDAASSAILHWPAFDAEGRPRLDDPATPNTGSGAVEFADRGALEYVPSGNRPPVAELVMIPSSGDAPLNVEADASDSHDPDGTIVSYRFDFGDGTVVGPQPEPSAAHTYAAGRWTAVLTVTDNDGGKQTARATVVANAPPRAALTVTPSSGAAPLSVRADASGSRDPDGTIASYRFDFGDGTILGPQPGATTTHTYAEGSWTARLVVTDDDGARDSAAVSVVVGGSNRAPKGVIDTPPSDTTITAGESISLSGTGTDPDNDLPLSFGWDLGGGALNSSEEDPGPVVFATPGIYKIAFTVKDARGLSDPTSDRRVITVEPARSGPADEIHWTITGQGSVTFDWRGPDNTIRYGLTSDYGRTAVAGAPHPVPISSSGPFWEVALTGLQENTLYHYSVANGPDHTFRTPLPRGNSGFSVYAEGDIGSSLSYRRMPLVQQLIAQDPAAFVLMVGDLTYANAHGQDEVDQHYNDVMVWSQDIAYMPAWGNHEWETPTKDDLRNYKGRFELPHPQTSPGSPDVSCCGEDWYWFDYGNVRFIAYPEPWSGAWSDWNSSAKTLMDEAQADTAITFIVTFGHRPAYSSGNHPGSPGLKAYLDALGATHSKYVLNLNGHSHDYERSYPQGGVVHITSGTGGANMEEVHSTCMWRGGCPPPPWTAFRAYHHAVVRLNFSADQIEIQAICGPAGDNSSNKNDITCNPGDIFDSAIIRSGGPALPPIVTAPATTTGLENAPISVRVTATDSEGNPIRSLTANFSALPTARHATFSADRGNGSGTLVWTPSFDDARGAPYVVSFTASNGRTATATTAITVENVDRAPLVTVPASFAGPDGTPITVKVTARDPDGDAIQSLSADLSALPGLSNAAFTVEPGNATGSLTWTPTGQDVRAAPYVVTFTARNGLESKASTAITVAHLSGPPRAALKIAPATGNDPLLVVADASGSAAGGRAIASYAFNFGDGATAGPQTAPIASHQYRAGSWLARLTVTDQGGASSADSAWVTVASVGSGPNLVGNDSFETDTRGWVAFGGSNIQRIESGFDGAYELEIRQAVPGIAFGINDSPNWVSSTLAARTRYRVTAWVRSDKSSGRSKLQVREYSNSVQVGPMVESPAVVLSSEWQALKVDYVAQATGSTLDLHVVDVPIKANETFVTDNISVRVAAGALPNDSAQAAALATERPVTARAFVPGDRLELGGEDSFRRVQIEPGLDPVTLGGPALSIVMEYEGKEISAVPDKTVFGDTDHNGVEEIGAVFSRGDLATLFGALPAGTSSVRVMIEGRSSSRVLWHASLNVRLVIPGGPLRAFVSPNPLRSNATLSFVTTKAGPIHVEIFDLSGRSVREIMGQTSKPAGSHELNLDGRDGTGTRLSSGVYFYRIKALEGEAIGRFVIMK